MSEEPNDAGDHPALKVLDDARDELLAVLKDSRERHLRVMELVRRADIALTAAMESGDTAAAAAAQTRYATVRDLHGDTLRVVGEIEKNLEDLQHRRDRTVDALIRDEQTAASRELTAASLRLTAAANEQSQAIANWTKWLVIVTGGLIVATVLSAWIMRSA